LFLAVAAALAFSGPAAAAPMDPITLKAPAAVSPKKDPPVTKPKAVATAETQPAQPHSPPWAVACAGASRHKPLDCAVEERVLLQNGQLLTLVRVSIPAATGKPTLLVQSPLGVALRAGVWLQLDAQGPVRLDFQTCDQGGCYVATPLGEDFLNRMLAAKTLTVRFTALNTRPVSVPLPLDGFAPAYARIQ
jgi:invasion protein IalB